MTSSQGRRECAEGLFLWFRELRSNPERSSLAAAVPGEPDAPLDQIYVELSAVDEGEVVQAEGDGSRGGRWRLEKERREQAISIPAMVNRTLERCVVVGAPGSGKSTMMKWLTWAAFQGKMPDFDVALEVKLSAYASALQANSALTPIEFFFCSLGQVPQVASLAAAALREIVQHTPRYLLLLDGWDEVPPSSRELVKQHLMREERGFITIITSRPSGMPRQLLSGRRTSYFRIAGLSSLAAEDLVEKQLRRNAQQNLQSAILHRLRTDTHLRDMASNPFLLSLLVQTLVAGEGSDLETQADVYRRMADCVRAHYQLIAKADEPLAAEQLDGLAELSFRLLSDPQAPRYLFSRRELERCLSGRTTEPILKSRFVTRPITALDEYALIHATFQEFFAADYASTFPADQLREFLNRTFHSLSRLVVAEFLAGFRGVTYELCQEVAREWWRNPDRFQQVAIRLARVAAAGKWPVDELGRGVREALWAEIRRDKNEDLKLCKFAVEAFALLDPNELVRRMKADPPSTWAINCVIDVIPEKIARDNQLEELLEGHFRDMASPRWTSPTPEEKQTLMERLEDWKKKSEDLYEAILRAGSSQEEAYLDHLVRIAKSPTLDESLREEAVTSISRIGGSQAVELLVDFLLAGDDSGPLAQMSAIAFVQPSNRRLKLDPRNRDRVLRRLCTIPPDSPLVKYLLIALEATPIRDGAEVVAELATSSEVSLEVNQQAISVLEFVTDRRLLESLLRHVESSRAELTGSWLRLAQERFVPIPLDWLKSRIGRSRGKADRENLLSILFHVLIEAPAVVRDQERLFLDLLIARVLHKDQTEVELALALTKVLGDVLPYRTVLFSDKVLTIARQIVNRSEQEMSAEQKQQLLLSIALVRHFRDTHGAEYMLGPLLRRMHERGVSSEDSLDYQLMFDLGDCLADLAPRQLLELPSDCLGAVWALRSRALKEGWLVYSNQILDAEGGQIAIRGLEDSTGSSSSPVVELREIIETLPSLMRVVLESYWLMVNSRGPCHPRDSYSSVYEQMKALYESVDENSELADALHSRFPNKLPTKSTWLKTLNRIEHRLENDPAARASLSDLGLYRH